MRYDETAAPNTVELGQRLSIASAYAIAEGHLRVALSAAARQRCRGANARLARLIAESRHVYGVTTGFGPLANRLVPTAEGVTLQQNLIHHLASGLGPELSWTDGRLVVLARLNALAQGLSGASEASIAALVAVMNSDLAPALPSRGTVGASGDLTPLAHLVLCLQGRGRFLRRNGDRLSGQEALHGLGLVPLRLDERDGLALVNGTSAMAGIAVRNAIRARRAVDWAIALTAGLAECLSGRAEAWDGAFARVRPHPGQIRATEALANRIAGSERLAATPIAHRRLSVEAVTCETLAGQDAYTLRCAPQVIGAVIDTQDWHDAVLETELNSVTDNPILLESFEPPALHGGNFMGQHVALASDALANAMMVLAGFAERQVARATDERLNRGLPAFLQGSEAGLNSGLMGAQVTATAVLAELRSTAGASAHSISTNGANQDVVSLGTIAARLCAGKLDGLFEIQAILALCVAQAIDLREREGGGRFSASAERLRSMVRSVSAPITTDRPLSEEIASLAERLSSQSPP